MSLARAFTKRNKRPEMPGRAGSTRGSGRPVLRHQISAPLQLLSTTNMLSFEAPDIHGSSASSTIISEDSESPRTMRRSPDTTPDTSSIESPPTSPETNHLSGFFQPGQALESTAGPHRKSSSSTEDSPAVPKRALSHTKATHKALARHRSISSKRSTPDNLHSAQMRSSVDMFSGDVDPSHPFGKELEQVNELVEDFGCKDTVIDEDTRFLRQRGLRKFAVQDYLMEIEGLYGGVFEDKMMSPAWI